MYSTPAGRPLNIKSPDPYPILSRTPLPILVENIPAWVALSLLTIPPSCAIRVPLTILGLLDPPYLALRSSRTAGPMAAVAGADITNSPSVNLALTSSDPYGPSTRPPPENPGIPPDPKYPPSLSSSCEANILESSSPPPNNLSSAKNPPAVAASCNPVPKALPLPPSKALAKPPAPFNPSFLSRKSEAAPSRIAPLINNPLNLTTALPNLVPNNRYAASNFGPLFVKNLTTDLILSLFSGSLIQLTSLIKNLLVRIAKNAFTILSIVFFTGATISFVASRTFLTLVSSRDSSFFLLRDS